MTIKKRTWMQITSDVSGRPTAFLEKLRVNRDAFILPTTAAAFKVFIRKVGEEGQEVEVTPESTVGEIKAQQGLKGYSLRFKRYTHRSGMLRHPCANVKMTDLGVKAGETILAHLMGGSRPVKRA